MPGLEELGFIRKQGNVGTHIIDHRVDMISNMESGNGMNMTIFK